MFPNLLAEMKRKGITQEMLAAELGITPTTLSMKLNGKSRLTLAECIEIRNIVGKEFAIDYLFSTVATTPEKVG